MLITFVHEYKAFLPEIGAYMKFFEDYGIATAAPNPQTLRLLPTPDVEWRFMGMQMRKNNAKLLIHEYASASVPPLNNAKDFLKRHFTVKPDFRLFLNKYVQQKLSFRDQCPFGFRDMGIYPEQLSMPPPEKMYDFIYLGSVGDDMQPNRLLDRFTQPDLSNRTLLVLSREYEKLQQQYAGFSNIIFKGPVPGNEVAMHIGQSRFAINYKPDIEPHNHQTSTKFLEYVAAQVPVITSDFAWMRNFQQQNGGNYFYLSNDLSNLNWENAGNFQYSFPDLSNWIWENQIRGSGVLEVLEKRFGSFGFGV